MSESDWIKQELAHWEAADGEVPPPWVAFADLDEEDTHPYSLFWRMGQGESFLMVWPAWWGAQGWAEAERLAYSAFSPTAPLVGCQQHDLEG